MDAIGITQEVVHTIKQNKLRDFLLKMDLEKYFDKVDWVFLRLVLIQIGLPLMVVNWIMACVSTTQFFVLVNGAP